MSCTSNRHAAQHGSLKESTRYALLRIDSKEIPYGYWYESGISITHLCTYAEQRGGRKTLNPTNRTFCEKSLTLVPAPRFTLCFYTR